MISVIIPTYNRVGLLSEAIDSVLSQPLADLEVIVVDDGSTDGTRALVAAYGQRVTYVCQHNAGVAAARNRGLSEAHRDRVLFLDSDDYLLPGGLAQLSAALDEHPEADAVFSDGRVVETDGRPWANLSDFRGVADTSLDAFVMGRSADIHSSLIRRECLLQIEGPFDAQMTGYEDMDMFMRLRASGARFSYLDVPTCAYRFHGANKSMPDSPYAERRRQSLLRTRFKALDASWYEELRHETRLRLFHDILTGPAVMDGEAIARTLGHARFAELSARERAALLYDLAVERMACESGWLADAGLLLQAIRLRPADPRPYAMLLLDLLPVPWRRRVLAWWRRLRSGPPVEDPIMAALRRGTTPT